MTKSLSVMPRFEPFTYVLLLVALSGGASLSAQEKPAGESPRASAPRHYPGIRPELVQWCHDASNRVLEYIENDREPRDSDVRTMTACRVAFAASDVSALVSGPHLTFAAISSPSILLSQKR